MIYSEHNSHCSEAMLKKAVELITAMHKADDEYGCGYYNQDSWIQPYEQLIDMFSEHEGNE